MASQAVGNVDEFFFRTTAGGSRPHRPAAGRSVQSEPQSVGCTDRASRTGTWGLQGLRFTERHGLSFRAEGFNWLNHPNLGGVQSNPRNATFGRVTSKNNDRRNIQLSLRYSF